MFFYAEGVNSFFYVEVNSVHTINCIVHDGITGLSCLIQAVYHRADRCCSYSYFESTGQCYTQDVSSTLDISHLPHNEVFCFVAITTNTSSSFRMILEGTFNTNSGTDHVDLCTDIIIVNFLIIGKTFNHAVVIAILSCLFVMVVTPILVGFCVALKKKKKHYRTQDSAAM